MIYISRLTDTNLSLRSVRGWSLDRSIFIQRLFLYYYCARPIIEVHSVLSLSSCMDGYLSFFVTSRNILEGISKGNTKNIALCYAFATLDSRVVLRRLGLVQKYDLKFCSHFARTRFTILDEMRLVDYKNGYDFGCFTPILS